MRTAWAVADLPAATAQRITVHPGSGCWIVGGYHDKDGYARIDGRGAHRVIWEHFEGPVPPGKVLDHREDWGCLDKACGYPGHLLPVTQRVNSTRDGAGGIAAINIRKTHCGACGREYDLFNTYYKPDGHRDCRACIRRRVREYKARRQQKYASTPDLAQAALWRRGDGSKSTTATPDGPSTPARLRSPCAQHRTSRSATNWPSGESGHRQATRRRPATTARGTCPTRRPTCSRKGWRDVGTPDVSLCTLGAPPGPECAHEHVAARVPKGRQGDKANRLCPCHDDTKASLSINPGNQGMRTVWRCGTGCDATDIRAALLELGVDPTCLGSYGDPERERRTVVPGMRIQGYDPAMVADAKRWHAVLKLRPDLNDKLYRMCIQAIAEGDGDLPGDPMRLLPVNSDDFYALAKRAGLGRYRYQLFEKWLKSEGA